MALSYSSYNPSACLTENGLVGNNTAQLQPNPCDPSSLNPYNVTSLGAFNMSMLREIFNNDRLATGLGLCTSLANILPRYFPDINRVASKPATLNVPALHMQTLIRRTVPSPYSGSSPGDATAWWYGNAENDEAGTKDLLQVSIHMCIRTICKARNFAGDADITGIGVSCAQDAHQIWYAELRFCRCFCPRACSSYLPACLYGRSTPSSYLQN